MDVIRLLVDKEIYAWTTKKWSSKPGLRELIGTPDEPILLTRDQAHRIWNTTCRVTAVELSMDLGKIYIALESDPVVIANTHLLIKFGVWIKVPADKNKYLKSLRMNSLLGKRKRDPHNLEEESSDDETDGTLPVEHNLLLSRTLQGLFNLSQMDPYIQLGDLIFERQWLSHGPALPSHQQSSLRRHQ